MSPLAAIGYPLLAVAGLNLCIGIFLLTRRRADPVARQAGVLGLINAVYCWVMAMAYVRAAAGLPYDAFYRAAWVGWIGMAPMARIIFLLRGDPAAAARWGRILYALWGGIWVVCLATDHVIEAGAASLVPFVDRVGWLERPARAAGALTLCWALVALYRVQQASAGRRRQQIAYFLVGLAAYGVAGLLLAGFLQVVGGVGFDPGLVSYFSLAWMACTFYAITRHRLFDVRFVVTRGLRALALIALLLAVQLAVFNWTEPAVGGTPAVAIAALLSGLLLFATPVQSWVERAIAWLVARRRYNYQRAMRVSVRALAASGAVDEVLAQLLKATRDTVASTSASVLLRDGAAFRHRQGYGAADAPAELAADGALAAWLAAHATPLVREEQELELAGDAFAALDADLCGFGAEAAVPMRYRGDVIGMLLLGPKADRDAFLQSDLDLLETLANEAAIAVSNARLLEDLQQAVRARDDFVAVAGHELRTPLTALRLNVQTVLMMLAEQPTLVERLRVAERQIARLTRLADELLDVSRITAGRLRLELQPTDLAALARESAQRFADEVQRAGGRLELELDDAVAGRWDPLRLEQVIDNLLSNAIKYAGGAPITLRVERDGEHARLLVRDRGAGIEAADQHRIFERFERAASPRSRGFGLGLWITRLIVEAHGGTIAVETPPGGGSMFAVRLPLDAEKITADYAD